MKTEHPKADLNKLVVGSFATNCYVLKCRSTNQALLIDPGSDGDRILNLVERTGSQVKQIVLTHGHCDHIAALDTVADKLKVPVSIHADDADMLGDPEKNLSAYMGFSLTTRKADTLLKQDDTITCGELSFKVVHTPGHSPGSMCLVTEGLIVTGDTLFAGSVGRTDFPGSSGPALFSSIKEKLLKYPDTDIILPGHGENSTIGDERKTNPFIQ